jgi:geranylgeranyl reductase family protein
MERFDAVIVGGGPAGSTCAWQLSRAGFHVCVLDRAVFPRDKVCAGWITPPVVELLELDIEEYRQSRVFQPITAFRTALIRQTETETRYAEPVSFGIRRCEFDHYLLQRSGARLRSAEPLLELRRSGELWIINNAISAPLLVGAGGHFCPVARRLNGGCAKELVVAAVEMEAPLSDQQLERVSLHPETPQLYFCDDLKGYGWCFRKGRFLNVGLGRQDARELPRDAQDFIAFLVSREIVPGDLRMRLRGHAYLLSDSSPRQSIGDGVLLVGDAAGLADPHSGEGIRPAVESGMLAAAAILSANGQYDRDSLEPYRQSLRARLGFSEPGSSLAPSLPPWLVHRLASRLMTWRWFTRHVVLDRWFLGRQRPPLASVA